MLSFRFTEAEDAYRSELRRIALEELAPLAAAGDREGVYPHKQIRRVLGFAAEFWKGREDERNLTVSGITAEEVARGDFNAVLPCLGPPVTREFLGAASEELKARWMPGLASGETTIGLCLTEAGAGSDMGGIATRAERRGDDWVLTGEKTSVSFLNADVFYVFARTDPASSNYRGLSAFLVPRDTPGLSYETYEDLGCRAVPRGVLRLDGVVAPAGSMVGPEGKAFGMIRRFFDINRAMIGLKCLGAAQQSVEETVAHVTRREQFGVPLATFQGVAFPLAEAATLLDAARWQCYRVLWLRQNGLPCASEGAMVKWWAPKLAAETIHRCLLLHGHMGYTSRLPLEQRLRDVIGWQIGDGSEQIMKLIIAREMLGTGGGLR